MGAVADFDKVPGWLLDDLSSQHETMIDGVRWVSDGRIAFAATCPEATALFPAQTAGNSGAIRDLLQRPEVKCPRRRLSPGLVVLEETGGVREPLCEPSEDGRGSLVSHYAVPMGSAKIRLSLCYFGVIRYLFGEVEWWGSGSHSPVVARVDGRTVAVVAAAPKDPTETPIMIDEAEAEGAPHEATAEARDE